MRIWLPFTESSSGADVFTHALADALRDGGCEVVVSSFPHRYQYWPGLLGRVQPLTPVAASITNSWTGHAFNRPGTPMITVVHLCVHDPAMAPYVSRAQRLFHRRVVHRNEARAFRHAGAVVAVSRSAAEAVSKAFPGVSPIVIPNGVAADFFTPGERRRAARDPFRLLFLGNPTRRKGVDLLRPVVERLGPGYELAITFDPAGTEADGIPNLVRLGRLDREGVRAALRASDALLFPSRLEGLPLAVLEAMACGLPVVASRLSSMPELIDDGRTGLLVDAEPDSIASAVARLAEDPYLGDRLSSAARSRVEAEFTLAVMADRYRDLAESLSG